MGKNSEIRKLKAELSQIGMDGAAVDQLTERITTTVDEVVEESTRIVITQYHGNAGRKNELENAMKQDIRRLFGKIERGLTIEFHAQPKTDATEAEKLALDTVIDLSRKIQFPPVANEPVLLASGEILGGEIHGVKLSKKSSMHKTTTTKKEPQKESKPE